MKNSEYELKKLLKLRLKEMQAKNPLFSLRAFAKGLGISPASLSQFFNGKRQFSSKLQRKIIQALNIAPDKKEELMGLVNDGGDDEVSVERIQLDTDSYHLWSDPLYYSVLCLTETKDFEENAEWMAERLNKTEAQVTEAMERLSRVGFIQRVDGRLKVGEAHLSTTDDVANASVKLRHVENFENAKEAVMNLPIEERYFQSETLAIGLGQMDEFKKAAQQFLDKMLILSQATGDKEEVYEFMVGFFPRTVKKAPCFGRVETDNGKGPDKEKRTTEY